MQFLIEIRDFNRNYSIRDFASNLINTQFRFKFNLINTQFRFKFIQNLQLYSITKLFNNKMFQDYSRLLQVITLFNHLLRRLSQLGCPRQSLGHLLLVEDQNSMPPARPQPRLIVHRHLRILLFTRTITTLFEFTLSLIRHFFNFLIRNFIRIYSICNIYSNSR